MARPRLQLDEILNDIIRNGNCYFSPPNGFKMKYPCIVYKYENNRDDRADNMRYTRFRRYTVTVITDDPDSNISDQLLDRFTYCTLVRTFSSDNLNHFVHDLFY